MGDSSDANESDLFRATTRTTDCANAARPQERSVARMSMPIGCQAIRLRASAARKRAEGGERPRSAGGDATAGRRCDTSPPPSLDLCCCPHPSPPLSAAPPHACTRPLLGLRSQLLSRTLKSEGTQRSSNRRLENEPRRGNFLLRRQRHHLPGRGAGRRGKKKPSLTFPSSPFPLNPKHRSPSARPSSTRRTPSPPSSASSGARWARSPRSPSRYGRRPSFFSSFFRFFFPSGCASSFFFLLLPLPSPKSHIPLPSPPIPPSLETLPQIPYKVVEDSPGKRQDRLPQRRQQAVRRRGDLGRGAAQALRRRDQVPGRQRQQGRDHGAGLLQRLAAPGDERLDLVSLSFFSLSLLFRL